MLKYIQINKSLVVDLMQEVYVTMGGFAVNCVYIGAELPASHDRGSVGTTWAIAHCGRMCGLGTLAREWSSLRTIIMSIDR